MLCVLVEPTVIVSIYAITFFLGIHELEGLHLLVFTC